MADFICEVIKVARASVKRTAKIALEDDGAETAHDRQFVTALARGIEILRCFDARHPELGTTEIAQMTGLPQPTVWRLCYTLLKVGCLVPCSRGDRLRVGTAVLGLGISALPSLDIGDLARAEMQRIADKFHAAVSLCVPEQTQMLITERAQCSSGLILNMNVGSRFEMASSSGCAYISALSDQAREELYARLEPHFGKRWPPILEKIEGGRTEFAKQGFVVSSGDYHPRINAVAVPIVLEPDVRVLSLTAGAASDVLPVKTLRQQVGPALADLTVSIRKMLSGSVVHGRQNFGRISRKDV
jgi:DNA-binding IclR family transcriptional regulator